MNDNKPTSLEQILLRLINPEAYSLRHEKLDEAIAAITALIPVKQTADGVNKLTSSDFHRGYDAAIDTIHRNFTGQTDNERKQP